jgi:hypothetical protein
MGLLLEITRNAASAGVCAVLGMALGLYLQLYRHILLKPSLPGQPEELGASVEAPERLE